MTTLSVPRLRLPRPIALVLAALVVAAGSQLVALLGSQERAPARPLEAAPPALEAPGGPAPAAGSLEAIDRAIAVWTGNLEREPADLFAATNLAIAYDARARLTFDVADHVRAAEAAGRALAIDAGYLPARLVDAMARLAIHDFAGARAAAEAILADAPGTPQAVATLGDAALELGDVTAAVEAYERLAASSPGPAVTARLARVAALRGDPDAALALADRAIAEAEAVGTAGSALGWYRYLGGVIALSDGRHGDATERLAAAASDWPDAPPVLVARARVAAADGDLPGAIALVEQAVEIVPSPEALALLGDLHAAEGDERRAADAYATVRAIGRLSSAAGGIYNRQLVLFELDHGGDVATALRLAEAELETRRDVYGWDAYAWALLANGRADDASAAMEEAVALGTRDARLWYHAGIIARENGDEGAARRHLEAALALDPTFDPLLAPRVREALAALP